MVSEIAAGIIPVIPFINLSFRSHTICVEATNSEHWDLTSSGRKTLRPVKTKAKPYKESLPCHYSTTG
jgi:hypothetical protein